MLDDVPTLQDLLDEEPGEDVTIVWGTGDLEPGAFRVSFLIVDDEGELTQAPTADLVVGRIDVADDGEVAVDQIPAVPAATVSAGLESVDAAPHEHEGDPNDPHDHIDATDLYVAHLELTEPGLYWAVATPRSGESSEWGSRRSERSKCSKRRSPRPSATPRSPRTRRRSTTGPPPSSRRSSRLQRSCCAIRSPTRLPPARRSSSPSRRPRSVRHACAGPVVETVDEARAAFEQTGIRFIQVEIYNDNDPNKGVNQWVGEWELPSEPWTFLVDSEGIIQERFEGAMSPRELADAIERTLL